MKAANRAEVIFIPVSRRAVGLVFLSELGDGRAAEYRFDHNRFRVSRGYSPAHQTYARLLRCPSMASSLCMGAATETTRPGEEPGRGSRVLGKARELGLSVPLDLERLAIARGCGYYERDQGPVTCTCQSVPLSNAELAIALVAPSLQPAARQIRLAAALLGAADESAVDVATLAVDENCVGVVRYIASCGNRFEPRNPFWTDLLNALPETEIDRDRLPHPTRFVEMTGIDRSKVGTSTRWIRARSQVAV